jgi:hypothetical protein
MHGGGSRWPELPGGGSRAGEAGSMAGPPSSGSRANEAGSGGSEAGSDGGGTDPTGEAVLLLR